MDFFWVVINIFKISFFFFVVRVVFGFFVEIIKMFLFFVFGIESFVCLVNVFLLIIRVLLCWIVLNFEFFVINM